MTKPFHNHIEILNPHNLPKLRSDAMRDACGRYPCSLRISSFIPGHRCADTGTTVGGHMPIFGKGVNTKVTDLGLATVCSNCHDLIDMRDERIHWIVKNYPAAFWERVTCGIVETMTRYMLDGHLNVPDGRIV